MTILKRDKPVARLVPALEEDEPVPQDTLKGSAEVRGDIVGPVLPPEVWEAERCPG